MTGRLLRRLWALPASLVGALLALTFEKRSVTRGILLAEGATWPRKLGWRYRAITLGHVVLAIDELEPAVIDHEAVHVRQFERWGPFMFVLYPLASIGAALSGGHHYRDNMFERQARREKSPRAGGGSSSLSAAAAGRGSGAA